MEKGRLPGFKVGDPKKPVTGPIAKDVAAGYSETLGAYLAVRTEDAAVKAANKALDALLTDETDDDMQTPTITAARETLAAAQVKQTAAHSKLYSVGAGPINMAGIAEWRAKFAVEDAVTVWNTAVSNLETADTALDADGRAIYADYVPLHNSIQLDGLVDAGVVNLMLLRSYANAEGNNTSRSQDAMSGVITPRPPPTTGGATSTRRATCSSRCQALTVTRWARPRPRRPTWRSVIDLNPSTPP